VLAVPGVGLWPPLFKPTLDHLRRVAQVPVRVDIVGRVVNRHGFEEQVDALAARCRQAKNLNVPHLTTAGATSLPERHRVRTLLWAWGATTETIGGSGHFVLADQPTAFADAIGQFITQVSAEAALHP